MHQVEHDNWQVALQELLLVDSVGNGTVDYALNDRRREVETTNDDITSHTQFFDRFDRWVTARRTNSHYSAGARVGGHVRKNGVLDVVEVFRDFNHVQVFAEAVSKTLTTVEQSGVEWLVVEHTPPEPPMEAVF